MSRRKKLFMRRPAEDTRRLELEGEVDAEGEGARSPERGFEAGRGPAMVLR